MFKQQGEHVAGDQNAGLVLADQVGVRPGQPDPEPDPARVAHPWYAAMIGELAVVAARNRGGALPLQRAASAEDSAIERKYFRTMTLAILR